MSSKKPKDDLSSWLEQEYRRDPGMEARVDALVSEMAIEQDLVALREASGISQRAMARRLGITQPAIAKLESGRVKNIGVRTLTRYAAALGGRVRIEVVKPPEPGQVMQPRSARQKLAERGRKRTADRSGGSA